MLYIELTKQTNAQRHGALAAPVPQGPPRNLLCSVPRLGACACASELHWARSIEGVGMAPHILDVILGLVRPSLGMARETGTHAAARGAYVQSFGGGIGSSRAGIG